MEAYFSLNFLEKHAISRIMNRATGGRGFPALSFFFIFHLSAIIYSNLVDFKLERSNNLFDKYLNTVGAAQKWEMFKSIPWFSEHTVIYVKDDKMRWTDEYPARIQTGFMQMFNTQKFRHMQKAWADRACIQGFYSIYSKSQDPFKKNQVTYIKGTECGD